MSYQEKRSLACLIATLVGYGVYFWYALQRFESQTFEPGEELQFWGIVLVILVPVQVVFQVLVIVFFAIGNAIVTKEGDPGRTDERDKLIDLKATRNCLIAFMGVFFAAMTAAMLGMSMVTMFGLILGAFLLSGVTLYLSQFYYYRRGF